MSNFFSWYIILDLPMLTSYKFFTNEKVCAQSYNIIKFSSEIGKFAMTLGAQNGLLCDEIIFWKLLFMKSTKFHTCSNM